MGIRFVDKAPLYQHSQSMGSIVSSSSAGVTLPPLGISILNTTATGASVLWTLPYPKRGYRKVIEVAGLGNSTTPIHINLPTSDAGFITSTQDMMAMATTGDCVVLVGQTTALWLCESRTTGVTFSSST